MFSRRVLTLTVAAALGCSAGCAALRDPAQIGSFVDDATVTTRIKSDIVADRNIDADAIQVETIDGTVTLSGSVRSSFQKTTAESIAMKVNGARQVKNEIAVRD